MTRNINLKTATLLICSGLILAACGLRGKLETPPPLWGEDNRPEADAPQSPETPASPEG